MARKKEVLSVTVTQDCIALLTKFVEEECKNGWATNKSQVVNNAILEFIGKNRKRDQALPSAYVMDAPVPIEV